jgi:hypothetical protein
MRLALLGFLLLFGASALARAETSLNLRADPVPIVEAEINGRPVRLEVDLRFPSGVALSRASADRLRVRRVPLFAMEAGLDGGGSMRGRIARPRIVFAGEDTRAWAGVFPAPVTDRADAIIGPGALPYDVITIELGPAPEHVREIVLPLADDGAQWVVAAQIGGETVRVNFDLAYGGGVFNRTAARHFDASGAIVANGELEERQVILGLRTQMQPVSTNLTFAGLPLGPAFARTNSPLLGADEEDVIVVTAEADDVAPPSLTLGRQALSSCASISVDRRTRRMTLRCAAD